ncbi:unnamed protein product [Aureobasidium pullulans]|nr:unnamed protein product [Aureobasidium pullulans]
MLQADTKNDPTPEWGVIAGREKELSNRTPHNSGNMRGPRQFGQRDDMSMIPFEPILQGRQKVSRRPRESNSLIDLKYHNSAKDPTFRYHYILNPLEGTQPRPGKMFARYFSISSILMIGLSLFSPTMAMGSFQSADNSTVEKRDVTITPVMNGINFPDPSVIRIGNEWWAFATMGRVNGKRVHVQMAKSAYNDFNTWTSYGERDALPNLPSWVHPDSPAVWAPDVVQLGPGRFIMYYTAALKSNSKLHCLGTASASTVTGPYTPIGPDPWACPTGQGGAIDPAGYYDPKDNTRWVVYKIDANAIGHGGFCGNTVKPILSTPIMLQKVSVDNGFTKIGLPIPMIYNDPADGPYVEAPALTKMSDGTYVLFYSSNCFVTPLYDVSYATSKNIRGPYKKFGGLIKTGTYGLRAPGGLDMAINGDHAVFHADWKGGRAMFTALIRPRGNNQLQVYVKNA